MSDFFRIIRAHFALRAKPRFPLQFVAPPGGATIPLQSLARASLRLALPIAPVFFQIAAIVACASLFLCSCASVPVQKAVPIRPLPPEPPSAIMGGGIIPPADMAAFLRKNNPEADKDFVQSLARYYVEEAAAEGVNHDIAFAQMCLETGYLRYGNLVTPDMNNFCGLGAIGPEKPGEIFPDPRTGVRAHIQHLKAYASEEPLNQDLVDPRFRYVRRGRAPEIQGLAGTWAVDKMYSEKIENILRRLYDFSFANSGE